MTHLEPQIPDTAKLPIGKAAKILQVSRTTLLKHTAMKAKQLTSNQIEIVDAIAAGRLVKEAADYLGKSPQTVFNTLPKIYDRLGIPHNLVSLAIWRFCTLHSVELHEFIRKANATMLLLAISFQIAIHHDDKMLRARRVRTRRNEIENIQIS